MILAIMNVLFSLVSFQVSALALIPQPAGLSKETILRLAQRRFANVLPLENPLLPMKDRVVVITGAAGGIGKQLSLVACELGASVVALDRDTAGLEDLCAQSNRLSQEQEHQRITPMPTRHEDLESVAQTARSIRDRYDRIDLLINNAGMTYQGASLEPRHGKDLAFTVNYLSHVLLTEMLLPKLIETKDSRVIQLTSTYHWKVDGSEIDPATRTLDMDCGSQSGKTIAKGPLAYESDPVKQSAKHVERSYANTKLAQIWHAQMLHRVHGINALCACPTWAGTGIGGEEARAFLEKFAFSVTGNSADAMNSSGPGVTSALNAMLRENRELGAEALSGKYLVANSRIVEYIPFKSSIMASPWMSAMGWRDGLVDFLGLMLLLGQRFTHDDLILQAGSPESRRNTDQMRDLYEWSKQEVSIYAKAIAE